MPEEARRELRAFVCERCPESLELDAEDATWRRNRATLERLLPDGREEGEQPADDEAAALAQADDRTKEVEEGEESRPIIGYGEPVEPWFWQDPAPANPGHRLTLCVDRLLALDTESVFVSGWIWDADRVLEAIDLVSPDGTRSPVLDRIAWLPRPDVSESLRGALGPRAEGRLGLISLVPLAGPLVTRDPYRIDVRLTGGRSVVLGAPPLTVDPIIARGELLRSLPEERYLDVRLIEEQVAPALERLQPRASEQASPDRIVELGPPPVSPAISMVIPLSRRFDLLEHQLAWIAGDAGLRECEIVYVIDADGLESHRVELWSALSRLYDVSLRLVVLSRNVGYAAAVNLGSQQARGRLLLLLHSDVLVERPGWARRLAEHYDASPEVGILAPKLLYEDGSIQQAGLTFDRTVHEVWSMKHRLGGLPRRHPAAAEARQVAAASGACLMIERSLFERVGGLRDRFIAGDLEDVDLCLRSQVEGRSTWYRPEAELYHLGGLSRSVERGWARNPWACLYNDWLLTRLWGERIEDMVDRFGS